MVKGKTSSGFEFSIPDGLDKDFRFVKAYSAIQNGDEAQAMSGAADLVSAIFADSKQEDRLYKHIGKSYGGRVPIDVLFEEIKEIISAAKQDENLKN